MDQRSSDAGTHADHRRLFEDSTNADASHETEVAPQRNSLAAPICQELRQRRLGLLRGLALVAISFGSLFFLFSFSQETPARGEVAEDERDYPDLFRAIERRLEESYVDHDRIDPARLVRRALSALELAADEIYVENSDPENPYVPVHVGDKTSVFTLAQKMSREEAVSLLERIFDFVKLYYHGDKSINELRYAAANGYLSGIDPHTLVFTPKGFEEFEVHIKGEIVGVGMLVGTDDTGKLQVKQVLKETPAFQAGFLRDDLIVKIDDESTINMTVMEAVQKIRGPRLSEVVLTVKRKVKTETESGEKTELVKTIPISVKRDRVEIKSVESKLITEWQPGDSPWRGGIGYVKCTNYDQNTYPSLQRNLSELKVANGNKPLAGLILDLRDNSGGLLTQAIKMADAFLSEGEIVGTAYKNSEPSYKNARMLGTQPQYPIIVLADQGSASGAEIVIGALQKNNRAVVLGTRTFGKGSVQQLQGLPNEAQLKITVSEYLLPGKISIQETGVVPDIWAKPAFVDEDLRDLYPSDKVPTESDYEAHLVSKYKVEEEPTYEVNYLWKSREQIEREIAAQRKSPDDSSTPDDAEGVSQEERFVAGELQPEKDSLVRMALRILALADQPFDPKKLLAKKEEIEKLQGDMYGEIVTRLGDFDVDWSAPTNGVYPKPGEVNLSLEWTHELVKEPSSDKEDPVPLNKLVLRAKLTNNGEIAVHRVKGLTRCDYDAYEDKELLFGKIAPGETIEREVKVRLPYFPRGQSNVITLAVSGPDDRVLAQRDREVTIEESQRPEFAYSATLRDASGETITHLSPGDDARLVLKISNVGDALAHKGIAVLRNRAGREIFLKAGRIEFSELDLAQSTEVVFAFEVREGAKTIDAYKFELGIYDSYSSAALSREILLPRKGGTQEGFASGKTFRPPSIELDLVDTKTQKPVQVTDSSRVQLRARVSSSEGDRGAGFHVQARVWALTPKNSEPDKFFYDDSRGSSEIRFNTRVDLTDGVNLVTVTATDRDGLQTRRSVLVRKTRAKISAATAKP